MIRDRELDSVSTKIIHALAVDLRYHVQAVFDENRILVKIIDAITDVCEVTIRPYFLALRPIYQPQHFFQKTLIDFGFVLLAHFKRVF
ncbi:hypothetical protein DTL21_22785 [Bremerella cremea]|uniref:Uncharacterized protein n=1 Tax=Blastopirellula marina TaxID=124 RepID=A0A2S8FDG5_9BACT|nr:hypothetical protein C5Y83_22750 [Blastopirellula marina]RCS43550.1 hypothetical protein DTL21_22785 [Bremerella cremea]